MGCVRGCAKELRQGVAPRAEGVDSDLRVHTGARGEGGVRTVGMFVYVVLSSAGCEPLCGRMLMQVPYAIMGMHVLECAV